MNTRIITALVLIIGVICILMAPLWIGGVFWGLVCALLLYEWAQFLPTCQNCFARVFYAALGVLGYGAFAFWDTAGKAYLVLGVIATLFWVTGGIYYVLRYPKTHPKPWLLYPLGLVLCILCAFGLWQLQKTPLVLLGVFLVTVLADTGAYFVGRALGKTPLAPHVSPNKTQEGFLGGCALVCTKGAIIGYVLGTPIVFVGLALVLALFSVLGDLFESLLKRASGIKDSGTILPGHGGVLDRLDSMLAVLPLALVVLHFIPLKGGL